CLRTQFRNEKNSLMRSIRRFRPKNRGRYQLSRYKVSKGRFPLSEPVLFKRRRFRFGALRRVHRGGVDSQAAAELRSAWMTGEAPVPTQEFLLDHAKIESPEVMLNSFLSASSSRLDPC